MWITTELGSVKIELMDHLCLLLDEPLSKEKQKQAEEGFRLFKKILKTKQDETKTNKT